MMENEESCQISEGGDAEGRDILLTVNKYICEDWGPNWATGGGGTLEIAWLWKSLEKTCWKIEEIQGRNIPDERN
jgi:hypothetical protein